MIKPILIFGYGNLSRGDDALGPLLLEHIESHFDLSNIELLNDFQLQIEHALDLEQRSLVLFVDASVANIDSLNFSQLTAARDKSYTTHAMSPAAVLAVYVSIKKQTPPPCFLLSIKAESMELGEGLSSSAEHNLQQANLFVDRLLQQPNLNHWLQQTTQS
ncbi:MAG: hydrogenase maturation protease [Methylococcales bacterium]|nr:MAG: hydrogenase maturation protease [Methylococcales bacterium]